MTTAILPGIEDLEAALAKEAPACEMEDLDRASQCGRPAAWRGLSQCCPSETNVCQGCYHALFHSDYFEVYELVCLDCGAIADTAAEVFRRIWPI